MSSLPAPKDDLDVKISVLKKEMAKHQDEVADCVFNRNSMFTVVGVGIGLATGLYRKSLRPFVVCVTLGTLGGAGSNMI